MKSYEKFKDNLPFYPPFNGFPKEGLKFLRNLKHNNNRSWFKLHKLEFEELVKLPMQSLINDLKPIVQEFAPDFLMDPQKSIFRIYRDVRFSKDKSPYKTHIAAIFQPTKNWNDSASLYLHIEPGGIFLGGGMYMPNAVQLKKFRNYLISNSDAFIEIVYSKDFKNYFNKIEGEKLKRVPVGFPNDHPLREYLKLKQFYIGYDLPESACLKRDFLKKIVHIFKKMMPFVNFINNAIKQ